MSDMTRKDVLKSLIVLPALAGLIATSTLPAEAKSSKAQFKYQDKPKGKAMCSTCTLFVPGKSKTALGSCKVVAGTISPHGWCIAYSHKG